jgi:rod shape-determining protein MreC
VRDSARIRTVLAVLLLISFTLVALELRNSGNGITNSIRNVSANLISPLQKSARGLSDSIQNFGSTWREIRTAREIVKDLESENIDLKERLANTDELRRRAAELDALLKIAGLGTYEIVPARVIAIGSGQDYSWTVSIDVGAKDGITTDMSVISGSGLVGRTISVAESTTLVSLLADPSSKVGARIGGKSELGFISGNGLPGELEFEIFDPLAEIQKGDRIVTWGSEGGRPFVAGVPIGEVISVKSSPGLLTKSARVKPYVKLSTLDLVSVVVEAPRIDPRDSLLPPMPVVDTPTPTTSPSATPSPSES